MFQVILFFHTVVAMVIVGLILIQQGKGAGIGASFGAGASQTVFGSRGTGSFLFKATSILTALFFVTSLYLGFLATSEYRQSSTPLQNLQKSVKQGAPEQKSE